MGDENESINQDEIERLLQESFGQKASPPTGGKPESSADPSGPPVAATSAPRHEPVAQEDLGAAAPETASMRARPGAAEGAAGQNDVERLLGQVGVSASHARIAPPREAPFAAQGGGESNIAQSDIEILLHQAEEALASIDDRPGGEVPKGVAAFRWEEFGGAPASTEIATLDLIRDVELDLRIELGRTQMYLEDVLRLRRGSVVTLDKLAGDPVDIFVNGRLIARGEVLVLNDNFCVRVAELVAGVSPA